MANVYDSSSLYADTSKFFLNNCNFNVLILLKLNTELKMRLKVHVVPFLFNTVVFFSLKNYEYFVNFIKTWFS